MRFLIVFLFVFLRADVLSDYKNGKYQKVCNFSVLKKYRKDERVLSLVGMACLKLDKFYYLPHVVNYLHKTPYGIKNSIYFLTIYFQKKLISSFLFLKTNLKAFSFPATNHYISTVFNALKNGNYEKKGDKYIISKPPFSYEVYKHKNETVIKIYKKKKLMKFVRFF